MNERIVQKGGALVETILLMLILLPILFGLVSTGNLIDLTQTTQQAARYATRPVMRHGKRRSLTLISIERLVRMSLKDFSVHPQHPFFQHPIRFLQH